MLEWQIRQNISIDEKNINRLGDLEFIFVKSGVSEKTGAREAGVRAESLLSGRCVSNPTMIDFLSHKFQEMRGVCLLEYTKKRETFSNLPLSGLNGGTIEPLVPLLTFLEGAVVSRKEVIENKYHF